MRRRSVRSLSVLEWQYLLVAVKELLVARVRHATEPSEAIVEKLRSDMLKSFSSSATAKKSVDVDRLSWSIRVAAARVPWRSDCLPQAMAADRWLRRHGIRAAFFIGVRKNDAGEFEAHAWLHHNGIYVTGGDGAEFAPLISPHWTR